MMPQEPLLQSLIARLKDVKNLSAIVLGGSHASGSQRPDSDIDIGLYYHTHTPLDCKQLRAIATALNDTPTPTVTNLGGWGRWVNGGAWLTIQGQRVDFLYRDIEFVSSTLDECNAGTLRSDYWQQPAYGFHNYIYCTETRICRALYDPNHIIEGLKAKVAHYPPKLKAAIIKNFLWSARFTLDNTVKAARRGEVYIVTGGLARALHCLVQVLYALNESWYINEKRLVTELNAFDKKPEQVLERIYAILGETGISSTELEASLGACEALYREIAALST